MSMRVNTYLCESQKLVVMGNLLEKFIWNFKRNSPHLTPPPTHEVRGGRMGGGNIFEYAYNHGQV